MKVIGICSSARKQGNTALLIRTVFGELEREGIETELVEFAGSVVEPCKACWDCGGKGNCVHRRDPFCGVFEKLKEADGVILGSPVYSANISANMQAFLERAAVVCDMNPGLLKYKVGAAVAAVRRSAPFAAGRGSQSAMPRPMVPRSRMPQLAGATAVAAMLLVVTMPAYGGTVTRDYTASEREQIVEKIDDMMVISKL